MGDAAPLRMQERQQYAYVKKWGPDTGFDCINNYAPSVQMADFLDT